MRNSQSRYSRYSCMYNLIHTKFNEDLNQEGLFSFDLSYPSFHPLKNTYFKVNPEILNNINSTIKSNVYSFKEGVLKEQQQTDKKFKTISNYSVTFNKNYALSTILYLMGIVQNDIPLYNQINNFNYDLLTGNIISIKDVFKEDVDYIKLITDYVNYKISQNKDSYYDNYNLYIPNDQSFYITDDAIVIYFEVDQIAPREFGVPKFKMFFNKFAPYISPRFYCDLQNSNMSDTRNHKYFKK